MTKNAARMKLNEMLAWFQIKDISYNFRPAFNWAETNVAVAMLLELGILPKEEFMERVAEKVLPEVEKQKAALEKQIVVAKKRIIKP